MPKNNMEEINIKEVYHHPNPQYNFSPGSTVEYTKDLQKYLGRISEISFNSVFDIHNFPNHNFCYTVVNPDNPNCIMETDLTLDKFVSIHMDSYSLQSAQKAISNILLVSTQALTSLAPDPLEKWYTHSRHLPPSFRVYLPFWIKIKLNTTYHEFQGDAYTDEKATQLVMYFSRTNVIPENISEAQNKITKVIHQDGFIVVWKILQENHPVFQTAGNNTLWPRYDASEPITTFIMSYQSHIAQESKKQRYHWHTQMLANIN